MASFVAIVDSRTEASTILLPCGILKFETVFFSSFFSLSVEKINKIIYDINQNCKGYVQSLRNCTGEAHLNISF